MRCDQFRGLNGWATNLISQKASVREVGARIYQDGKIETFDQTRDIGVVVASPSGEMYEGMFGNEYYLMRYTLPDGRVYTEFVQANPWSSGPIFFLALKDSNGNVVKESMWDDENIENA